jgi:PII-like signaling protein
MQYIRGNIIYRNDVGRGHTMGCHSSSLLQLSTIAMPTCVAIHCVATTLAVATTL